MADDRNAKQSDTDAGEPLPAEAAAVLAQWATSDPPAGFVDRVVTAARQAHAVPPPARRRRPIVAAITAVVVVAASVTASVVLLRGGGKSPEEGARVVQDRETIVLGRRGVAVAEAGTEITWTISATGSAEVHQTRGDVFYRVETGGPFVVETPYGRVMVRGTCFRVEVLDMSVSRQAWIGGALGAALAATIVIGVYEGQVRVVNARGQADARAGERIALGAGAAPTKLANPATTVAALEPPPPGSATVQELLRRDQAHRGEIALLRARLSTLETASPEAAVAANHRAGKRKIVDLSQGELAEMAKDCEIRFDIPGYGIEPRLMNDKLAAASNLSADDRAIYDQTVRKENGRYMTALRALYQELAGSDPGDIDAQALTMEILQKSPSSDVEAARKRLAQERAGMIAPPADSRNQTVIERLFRLEISAGTALEQLLAAEFGPDKAHQIRTTGWAGGDDNILSGCPD